MYGLKKLQENVLKCFDYVCVIRNVLSRFMVDSEGLQIQAIGWLTYLEI